MMGSSAAPRSLVVNFNAPELNQLAAALAARDQLVRFVRPYVNKQRGWERALATLPVGGRLYASSFGRRKVPHPSLAPLTREAGIASDMLAAVAVRSTFLPDALRHRLTNGLIMQVREAVAEAAAREARDVDCVVAYEGFGLPSFRALRATRRGLAVLNYPVAHHRSRRAERLAELENEPRFASTYPGFDDWAPGHEERLDEEIELADAILLGSTYAADTFAAQGVPRDKLRVIPYGVDLDTFRPAATPRAPEPGRLRAIFVGQLTQRKGLSYLLRAWETFRRPGADLTLVGMAIGDPAALAPWAGQFTNIPHRTRPELAQLYQRSDVFVFPTLVEGMPLVVLEAMACGLPVIVTPNGPSDVVRDGIDGFIVPPRDPEAIVRRLEQLHRDPALRLEMGRQAAARAAEFSWNTYARRVIDSLAAAHRAA